MNTSDTTLDNPEVARLLEKMREEYTLARAAREHFRAGKRADTFVAARYEAVTLAHLQLAWLIGREQATHAVCHFFQQQIEREKAEGYHKPLDHEMIFDNTWLSLILVAYRLRHDQIVQPIEFPPSKDLTTQLNHTLYPVFTELCQYLGVRGTQQRLQAILDVQAPGQTGAQFSLGRALATEQIRTFKAFHRHEHPDPTAGDVLLLHLLTEYTRAHEVAGPVRFEPERTEEQRAAKRARTTWLEERFLAASALHLQLARLVGLQPAARMAYTFLESKVNLDLTFQNLWLSPILAAYRIRHERLIQLLRAIEKQHAIENQENQEEKGVLRGETEQEEMVHWLLAALAYMFRILSEQLGEVDARERLAAILDGEALLIDHVSPLPQVMLPGLAPAELTNHAETACLAVLSDKGARA